MIKGIIMVCLVVSFIGTIGVYMVVVDDGRGGFRDRYSLRIQVSWYMLLCVSFVAFMIVFRPDLS